MTGNIDQFITYGCSQQGRQHIKMNKPCQDSNIRRTLSNGWILVAIADGVGSAKRSELGSREAVDAIASFCELAFPVDACCINLKSMMRTAMNYALKKVYEKAEAYELPAEALDTTLSVILWNGSRYVFGHSGDGGILGMHVDGRMEQLTHPLKGEDGVSVLPLRAGYQNWYIDAGDDDFVSFLLMTDGMYDIFTPYLLRETEDGIYHSLAQIFMNPAITYDTSQDLLQERVEHLVSGETGWKEYRMLLQELLTVYFDKSEMNQILSSVEEYRYPVGLLSGVMDDRTVAGVMKRDSSLSEQMVSDYIEPDWVELKRIWTRRAYQIHSQITAEGQEVNKPAGAKEHPVERLDVPEMEKDHSVMQPYVSEEYRDHSVMQPYGLEEYRDHPAMQPYGSEMYEDIAVIRPEDLWREAEQELTATRRGCCLFGRKKQQKNKKTTGKAEGKINGRENQNVSGDFGRKNRKEEKRAERDRKKQEKKARKAAKKQEKKNRKAAGKQEKKTRKAVRKQEKQGKKDQKVVRKQEKREKRKTVRKMK